MRKGLVHNENFIERGIDKDAFWNAFIRDVPQLALLETVEWDCADACAQGVFPVVAGFDAGRTTPVEIGRASCRERV